MNALYVEFIPTDADVQEIKAINGVHSSETKHDEYIITMIPLLLESVMAATNNDFGGIVDGRLRLPGGVKIYMAKAIEHNLLQVGLKSRSMGSVSYSYDLEMPESIQKLIRPYKKVRFHASR